MFEIAYYPTTRTFFFLFVFSMYYILCKVFEFCVHGLLRLTTCAVICIIEQCLRWCPIMQCVQADLTFRCYKCTESNTDHDFLNTFSDQTEKKLGQYKGVYFKEITRYHLV